MLHILKFGKGGLHLFSRLDTLKSGVAVLIRSFFISLLHSIGLIERNPVSFRTLATG